jgi:hypothetical protein
MEEALGMDIFDSRKSLVGDEEDGLERKHSVTVVEKILERRAEKVTDQHAELALPPKPPDLRDSHPAGERLVCLCLGLKFLGVKFVSGTCELDGDFLTRLKIGPCCYVSPNS